jgi:hypothetical protein
MTALRRLLPALALTCAAGLARAAPPPEAAAVLLPAAPTLDGDVLGDAAWAEVSALDSFWQITPDEGQPASERTEVRIGYTKDTLFIGVVCHDREPGRIIVAESRRDSPLEETDSFQLILDTFRDGQSGFVFGTNPTALEFDGQVTNEGREADLGPGLQTSTVSGFNKNWDASWEVRTRTAEFGWSAEFAIPFRTLRYRSGGAAQVWGLNFQRNIRRRNETSFWAPLPRQFNLYRVSLAGSLRGLEVPSQRNLKITPYVLGETARDYQTRASADWSAEAGVDLKYSLTPSLTLDATVNTDFAQVEVDEQQINLDRFNLFFPEKRPFFLENAGQFAVGTPAEVELFFTRRIGIGPRGEVVPILAGGRLSGKVHGFNVGLLDMQTRSQEGVTLPGTPPVGRNGIASVPSTNFGVVRLGRDLPNRSGFGAIFVNRQGTGEAAPPGDYNRTYGVDGRWGIRRYGLVSGYVAKTSSPNITRNDHAFNLGASYLSPSWDIYGRYTEVGEGFNPEVGFLARRGYRKPEALVYHVRRMNGWMGLHEIRPHVSYRGFWKPDGFQESGFMHMDSHWEWRSGYEVHTGVNLTREGLRAPFEIYPGVVVPPGTYDHSEVQIVFNTNKGAPVSLDTRLTVGGWFGGDRVVFTPVLRARAGDAFNAEAQWARNDLDLPGGAFTTNLVRLRLSYSFTPRLFVQSLVQYNDLIDNWSTNLRLGWLQTANVGLFIVFNENREVGGLPIGPRDRSLVVKFSRMFDVLD